MTVTADRETDARIGTELSRGRGAARGELVVLALIVLIAFVARFWAFSATGMEHYDEGVYAISADGLVEPPYDLFPGQIRFSPPFYFTSIGVAVRLFGGEPDRMAALINILLGTATVLAVWWMGRVWFSARAGAIAATLLALSQFHILMSRVVLTDAAFALWFVLALATITLAIERDDFRMAVLAGLATGLAWNTKYHGWFALMITGVALVPTLWRERSTAGWRRPLALWATAAAVAAVIYLPWAAYIRIYSGGGGYGSILSYYATMLRIDWMGNLVHQAMQQHFLEGVLSRAAPLVALGCGLLVRPSGAASRVLWAVAGLGIGALLIGQAGVAVLLSIAALPLLIREFDRYRSRVLLCWVGLWVVAAPVYHPYARLILPFTIATFVLAGFVLDRLLADREAAPRRSLAGMAFAGAAAAAVLAFLLRDDPGAPWRSSRSLAQAASAIAAQTSASDPVFVLGEPPIAHYLQRLGHTSPSRTNLDVLDTISRQAYLVTGVYARRAPMLRDRVGAFGERLTTVAVFPFEPNDLRLLDDLDPDAARAYRAARDSTFDLTLYRVAPARSAADQGVR